MSKNDDGFTGLIPGNQRQDHVHFIQMQRTMLLGDRQVKPGDVVMVQPIGQKPSTIMPIDPYLYMDRAASLIKHGFAKEHPGPATIELGHSIRKPAFAMGEGQLERQVIREPERQTATAAPQRKGSI